MHRSAASAALHAGPRIQRLRCARLLNLFVLTAMSSLASFGRCYCQSLQETIMSVGLMATCDCHVVPTGL